MKKCGFVALMGRPNAGKSTLMNALVGRKLAAVSRKPQTTRNHILGIVTEDNTQIIFVDTPGIHRLQKNETRMNAAMNREAWKGGEGADVVIYLVSSVEEWHREDAHNIQKLLQGNPKHFQVLLSQIDRPNRDSVTEQMRRLELEVKSVCTELNFDFSKIKLGSISAKRPAQVAEFLEQLILAMPEAPEFLYPEDYDSDRPTTFYCGELIREQVFRQMGKEIPYQCGVLVEDYKDRGDLVVIKAKIITARDNHKGMIVGQRGSRIKEIGVASREALEKFIGKKVHLELLVSVDEDWLNRPQAILDYVGID